jgi:threonylcarbamoyladenosine tRNA methylthiotransferase MtaB
VNVLLHTFGCKANQYDTELVRQRLADAGCTVVERPEAADAAVINSCTVTHVGEAKLRGLVRRLARRRPGLSTVVIGCAAALDDGTIARLPSVTDVIGGADPDAVAAALGLGGLAGAGPEPGALRSFSSGSRAWLKIQDGCDEHCTFCATTLARGANRSREAQAIVAEAQLLSRRHAEIVLTGVHIGSYGRDRDEGMGLGRLVALLADRVPETRFRLSSVEATEVDEVLEALMREAPDRLAPHLHAPLQSGSDRVLKRMGRHWYTAAEYRRRVERLAERVQPLGLGADVIVGFPGEGETDHAATVALVEALPFTYLHVFPYSPRRGTAAPRLGGAPPADVIKRRGAELRALAARREAAHRSARAGEPADLVLESRRGGVREAVSEDYLAVELPAAAPWLLGRRRVRARLALSAGRLVGEPLEAA